MKALRVLLGLLALVAAACQSERRSADPASLAGPEPRLEQRPAEVAPPPPERSTDSMAESMGEPMGSMDSMQSMDPMPREDSTMAGEPPAERAAEPRSAEPWSRPAPLDARPCAVPWPEPPAPERTHRTPLPIRQPLERNAAVADRFTSSGQQVTYAFVAEAGELSLLELAAYGYERGAGPRLRLVVLDAQDNALFETVRGEGVAWRALCAFVAPADGQYRCVLASREDPCRFVLARHSDYSANGPEALDLGGRERVNGHVAGAGDSARYSLRLAAGEDVALKLEGTRLEARQEARMERNAATGRGGERGRRQYAPCVMTITCDGAPAAADGTFALLRAERETLLAIEVRLADPVVPDSPDSPDSNGALFDLVVERSPKTVALHGVVVDREDRPVAGVELEFLREPDGDLLGRCTSSEAGAWAHALLKGDVSVHLRRPGERGMGVVSTHVAEPGELNLLWLPRGGRGR